MNRTNGILVLKSILSIEKNITILEKNIFNVAEKSNNPNATYDDLILSVYTDIKDGKKLNDILKTLKNNQTGFHSDEYVDMKHALQEQQNFLENPFEVDEGVIECKCGSRRTISFSKQTRCGDEGTTVFAKCVDCGKSWIM